MASLSEVLRARGYVYQHSSETLEEITDREKRTVYLGIDPSADSLHAGNLVGLLVLRRFLEDGHKVILLTGGGTGMIGDPGGKSEERNLLDEDTVQRNAKAVAVQIRKVFGGGDFIEENNAKWLSRLNLLEFLRDVGKHFTVNAMIKKDIVRDRLEQESPISFTEFSYALLQGYDFLHLNEEYSCDVQVGGSDQWSNILAGVEFIRKREGRTVYALTWPLVMNKATGKKFGKSEQGAVWLDAGRTSIFDFYQFWFNTEDENAAQYLRLFTLLDEVEIEAALELQRRDPAERHAQRLLAREVTALVHGESATNVAERVSLALFGDGNLAALDKASIEALRAAAPSLTVQARAPLLDVLVRSGLAASKREARQLISDGAVMLGGTLVGDETSEIEDGAFVRGLALLRRGKRNVRILVLE
ncbi:MAG TPA: tyrosine--tRNA ligase [Candidatus Paceibacterota bacterium]